MTHWRVTWLLLAGGISIWLAWLYISPHFNTYPEQDDCSFGPVSNERYRELLALARQHQASGRWSRLRGDGPDMNENLQGRLDDIMDGMDSIYERIAATHAVMRALGAYYVMTMPANANPFAETIQSARLGQSSNVRFIYNINVHRLGGFAPILKNAVITNTFVVDNYYNISWSDRIINNFYTQIKYPFTIYQPPPNISRGEYYQTCPAVPSSEWVADYKQWLASTRNNRSE